MALVDSNIILDIVTADPVWVEWSSHAMADCASTGPLFINDVIYAEIAARFEAIELLDGVINEIGLEHITMPRASLFAASKVHLRYRAAGGPRTSVLPDFFIGAHAAVLDVPLLTRDVGRYRTYFPSVSLITPKMN